MKQYQYILFDLDGTITDPGEGITNSVMYALEKFGIIVTDNRQLYKFIGPPLVDSFMKYYRFSQEQAKQAVEFYREYYREKGIFQNLLFEGIEQTLRLLKDNGKTLVLATSKPEEFAKQILQHFQLTDYFFVIAGATMDETRNKKEDIIFYALEQLRITGEQREKILMIGDREHDVLGAGKNGIDSMGVLFGYGSKEELENAKADYIVDKVEDIGKLILQSN